MSQMHEITTTAIVQTSNSNSSQKLINGFHEPPSTKNESVTKQHTIDATKNDRNNNNNNVMKNSISPKNSTTTALAAAAAAAATKLNSTKLNNILNRDPGDKNEINKKTPTSQDIVINHVDDQQPLIGESAAGNVSHKLTISSSKTIEKFDGKGHDDDDDATVGIASNDRNVTLKDDIVPLTQPKVQFKSRLTRFHNEMDSKVKLKLAAKTNGSGGKKTIVINAIDTVDSGTGAVCYTQQPEQETVISMNKTNERTSSNLNKYTNNQDKQITNDTNRNAENDVFDKHQNNCDNFVEKYGASKNDMNGNVNGDAGGDKMNDSAVSDIYSDNFDDDPYAELQSYLEKVKREINEVFEQRKLNGSQTVSHGKLEQSQRQWQRIAANDNIAKHDNLIKLKNSMHLPLSTDHSANIRLTQTNDWANNILRDLDDLVLSNKRYTDNISQANVTTQTPTSPTSSHKRSTIINVVLRKTTPVSSPTTSHAPATNDFKTDNNNILKPEKHTYIPLQSFNLESPSFSRRTSSTRAKKNSSGNSKKKQERKINQFDFVPSDDSNNLPVLKIEEDFEDISMTNGTCKTISTQTSPINERNANQNHRKGSNNSLWTSDESILRCGETVDEDNKSTSSSACEETGGGISSSKSDSSGLDNAESGIGTATPPKDQENWRQFKSSKSKPTNVIQSQKNWTRHESVMTQTSQTDEYPSNIHSSAGCDDDMNHLEVLSLCEGTTDEYDIIEDDYLSDDRKLDKSNDTSSSCTKSSSAERDDDSDIVSIRNRSNNENRAPATLYNLPHEVNRSHTTSLPIHYSDKSLNGSHTTKSESGSSSSGTSSNVISRILHPPRRPFALHLNHEPFHNIIELPSPSSASLHSGHGNITMQELTTKSNSAPILLKNERKRDDFIGQPINLRYSRSQSDRYLAEIEAIEACKWLRAAGFPQYAQMYEDLQFPIDLSNVAKDHPFLENDPLQSLYRRLVALNRCATMRLDSAHKHGSNNKEESEDDEYALSENWTFQQTNRRWSRVGEMEMEKPIDKMATTIDTSRESSPEHNNTNDEQLGFSTLPSGVSFSQSQDEPVRLRRTGSERLKDGAKAFLRRVESIKSRRRKRQNRDGVIIIGPQALDLSQMNQRMTDLRGINIVTKSTPPSPAPTSPYTTILTNNKLAAALNSNELNVITTNYSNSNEILSPNLLSPRHCITLQTNSYLQGNNNSQSNRTSPIHFFAHNNPGLAKDLKASGEDSSSYCSDASQESSTGGGLTSTIPKKRPSRTRRFLQKGSKVEDIGALSDSECHQMFTQNRRYYRDSSNQLTVTINNNNNNNNTSLSEVKAQKFSRGGSLNLGKESQKFKESFKTRSFRSRSSARIKPDGEFDSKIRTRSSVVRWHSFQNAERPDFIFKKCPIKEKESHHEIGMPLASMSCGQLQVVRKLALVTLTGYMERYCPTHRSGWNWELPKFIKKIKTPDYKDKKVFGVPLVLLLQRTGQTIPTSIQTALKWLKLNALDQVGLFRKSGVKSRILKLKEVIEESHGDVMETYDLQQAYDVADMLKQYFRELPDTLLTAKMSDTFIAIFQHLPPEVQFDAVQSAILLLPDEHREVLQYLLDFLHNVASHAMINQMTSNNLAVCLAPSLFHGTFTAQPRSTSVSPRRRKPIGMPDSRELTETRASHDCLAFMIEHCRKLFAISHEKVQRCNFNYMEESKPVPLDALGEGLPVHDWRGYLYECTSATIKEGRERSRGWNLITTCDPFVEVAHKKVGDGHPLRLWRCTTDIDATPLEILHFIFKERRQWDPYLIKCRIVEQLDDHSEIFQCSTGGHTITDYCVLRSWRADLPRGACVIVETSVAHPDAHLLLGGFRGVVLASRYLIEPTGNGKSKVMHLARVDTKGRSPEWYNKCYGHICSQYLSKIRSAFKHHSISSDGKP